MTDRRIDCFFYGLFMDAHILSAKDVSGINPRKAFAQDFSIHIGARATLSPSSGARAYGMIFEITQKELDVLYGAPGLEDYIPEEIIASTLEGASVPVRCYNLASRPAEHEANPEYVSNLKAVLKELDFPKEYIREIR